MAGLSYKDDYLETPDWILSKIETERDLVFNMDLSASIKNTKTKVFFSEQRSYLDHTVKLKPDTVAFLNPPRSLNDKFVNQAFNDWKKYNVDIVMLLTWNDLGNKYGEKLFNEILQRRIKAVNLGKIKFCKDGKLTDFVSRLTYGYFHFKKQN